MFTIAKYGCKHSSRLKLSQNGNCEKKYLDTLVVILRVRFGIRVMVCVVFLRWIYVELNKN